MTCSAALATGSTSFRGNLLAQSHDTGHYWETLRIHLVIPEKENRYLRTCGPGPDNLIPVLSEKGVAMVGFARPAMNFPAYPGAPKRVTEDELIATSSSAREYIKTWSENMAQYGTEGFMGANSIGRMMVDTREGYLFEGANWVYGDPANHAIHGPMTDQIFACGNFFVNSGLKGKVEAGMGVGYNRAKRIWQLLVDRQYDCHAMEGPYHNRPENAPYYGAGITLPYFMSVFRNHGNLSPAESRMSNYVPEERGIEAVCIHGMNYYTKCATICSVVEDHADLFSCLWMTFGQPCLSPFLPVYIGVNELPEDITREANPVARVFEDLRLALEFRPDYAGKLTQYWTVFEIQAIEESARIERAAAALAEKEDIRGARTLLTEFVAKKWAAATLLAEKWLQKIRELPV
jgi:hypothetical protein